MSTIESSNQSSIVSYTFQQRQTLLHFISDMPKQKITPKAKYPVQTQKFIQDVSEALKDFEENIRFPGKEIRASAYRVLLEAYHTALTSIWSQAQFANTEQILKTISDRQMTELTTMSKLLEPEPTTSKVSKEPRTVPDLEELTESLQQSSGGLPSVESCAQIASVFTKLADAHRTYAKAADGLAQLSTVLNPSQYTTILKAAVMPTIQIVIPGKLVSPVTAPPPPPTAASTALGKLEIIKYTKHRILPNPDSSELALEEENSATRVLAAAIYLKIENMFFDETSSRLEIATAFKCNISQLSKAVTGVHYKGGPHKYKPKKPTKRTMETADKQAGPSKRKALPSSSTQTESTQVPDRDVQDDTLPSSSDSDLPLGLLN